MTATTTNMAATTTKTTTKTRKITTSIAPSTGIAQIEQSRLEAALKILAPATKATSLPVLGNIFIVSGVDVVELSATNLEVGIRVIVPAALEGAPIRTTTPAKLFTDIVSNLAGYVGLEFGKNDKVKIEGDGFAANLNGISAEDFPILPMPKQAVTTIPASVLTDAVQSVAFAAAADADRPALNGVLIRIADKVATFVGCDGFRLVERIVQLDEAATTPLNVIIPHGAADALVTAMSNATGTISLCVSDNDGQIAFYGESITVVSRIVDATYPTYSQIIPGTATTYVTFDKAAFAAKVKLANYVGTIAVISVAQDGKITIAAEQQQVGDSSGSVAGEHQAGSIAGAITCNLKLLMEALTNIDASDLTLEVTGINDKMPGLLRPAGQSGHVSLIMPMTMR